MDAITFRGAERLLAVTGAIFLAYLGYRLFDKGHTDGEGRLRFESAMMKIVFSGTGPGLFFMAFGAAILLTSLLHGGATISSIASIETVMKKIDDTTLAQASELTALKQHVEKISLSTQDLLSKIQVSKTQRIEDVVPNQRLGDSHSQFVSPPKIPADLSQALKNSSKGETQ